MVNHVNAGFMPLARECIAMAHERSPHLAGLPAISIEVVADETLGGVIFPVDRPRAASSSS